MEKKTPEQEPFEEKVPIEPYLEQFTDLLQYLVENIEKSPGEELPDDLEKKFAKLSEDVKAFCQFNEAQNSSPENIFIDPSSPISKSLEQTFKRGENLELAAEEKLRQLEEKEQESGKIPDKPTHAKPSPRKNKFKRLGQNKV